MRVSAHSLAVEQGRWNRRGRGRLPIEERLCPCGQIQTERHVFEYCHISLHLRRRFNITTLENLLNERQDHDVVCEAVHFILSLYN